MKKFPFLLLIFFYCCSDKISSDKNITNVYYENAWEYLDNGKTLNAFVEFGKAKDVFLKQKDTLGAGKSLMNMGIISTDNGDYFGGQEISLEAVKYFNESNSKHFEYINANYNNLGIATSKLENYTRAIEFYKKALKFTVDFENISIYTNNLANSYRKEKDYKKAISIFEKLIKDTKINNLIIIKSKVIDNLAFTKWLQNPKYNPVPEFKKALNIRLKEQDNWGLNSSYSHLADYYADKQKDSALLYANKMYSVSKEIKSPDDQIEALQKLISLENSENSKQYFKVYQKLNDSLHTARSKAKNQFALIRYETEKNKADFLKAKAESAQRQNYIIKQYILIGFIISVLIFIIISFRRRQKRLQQEKLLEVKNTELKYSKKIHDRVANRIYQIMSQVENTTIVDKNALLFGLENVYETTRDISYDNKEINENQNYYEQLHKMLDSYSSDSVKIIYNGNNEKLWEDINFHIKTETYLILQELMTNMKKHSKADKVF